MFFFMIRRPPRSTRTDTLFPYTTLVRSSSFRSGHCRDKSSQSIDPPQDVPEQIEAYGNFGRLERDVVAMSDDLGADLDQLLPDGGQRPMLHLLRPRQAPRKVGEIVGQGMRSEERRVGKECVSYV